MKLWKTDSGSHTFSQQTSACYWLDAHSGWLSGVPALSPPPPPLSTRCGRQSRWVCLSDFWLAETTSYGLSLVPLNRTLQVLLGVSWETPLWGWAEVLHTSNIHFYRQLWDSLTMRPSPQVSVTFLCTLHAELKALRRCWRPCFDCDLPQEIRIGTSHICISCTRALPALRRFTFLQ